MKNKLPIDLELLIPILLGGISVVGIAAVLIIGRALSAPAEIDATPSSTPFQFVFIGTEPGVTTPLVEGSDIAPTDEFPTEVPVEQATPSIATPTRFSLFTPTLIVFRTATNGTPRTGVPIITRTATATRTSAPSTANTYDDSDSRLNYSGSWINQTGVNGAYQETLHISSTVGNSVTFTFTGTEIHVFYQAGPSLGSITITVDSFGYAPISEAQSTTQIREWASDTLSSGTHTVVIEHYGGGSINVDRFYIPPATPTPTRTPTAHP